VENFNYTPTDKSESRRKSSRRANKSNWKI